MTYEEWINGTRSGVTSPRSNELKAVDKALLGYERAQTPYGREWEGREARIALEKWKKSKGPGWQKTERNRTGLVDRLDRELPRLALLGNGYSTALEGEGAEKLRKGVLFFLSRSSTSAIPTDLTGFLNDGTDTSSDLHAFVDSASATGWRFYQGKFYDAENKQNGFLESLSETLIEYIKSLAETLRLDEFAGQAAQFVVKHLPELLLQVFAGLLSKLTVVVDIGKNLKQAVAAAHGVWKTRLVEDGVMSGHPRIVIHSVREQIQNSGYSGIKGAVKAGVLAGLTAIPGAGAVIGVIATAIANVWGFVTKVFDHFREVMKLNKIFRAAIVMDIAELHTRAADFQAWFLKAVKDLPILSSYFMSMPLTGSYYGFLTLVGTNGTEMNYKQLERNYAQFNDVKVWAKQFVREHGVKLNSADPIIQHSLEVARGERQQWDNAKSGVVARVGKIAIGVIETAAGSVARRG